MQEADIYLSYKDITFSSDDSLWEPASEWQKNIHINLLRLNFKILSLNFKNIFLITDKLGESKLSDLKFSNIFCILDDIDSIRLDHVPSLCKLYAYNFAAKQKRPFFHIDNDFFIFKTDDLFFQNKAVAQSKDTIYSPDISNYHIKILKYCKNKYFYNIEKINYYYNCGIIGGSDCSFFEEYSDTAIKFVTDKTNTFWQSSNHKLSRLNKSIIAEQVYYTSYANYKKYDIKLIKDSKTKFVHFYGFGKYQQFQDIKHYIEKPENFITTFS